MSLYDSFAFSAQGYNHIKVNKECQDASLMYSDDVMSIIVVADGHGSDNYPRTASGSVFAVEETVKSIKSFVQTLNDSLTPFEINDDQNKQLADLAKNILLNWHNRVDEDIKNKPFSVDEVEKVSEKYKSIYLSVEADVQEKKSKAYGSTLIAVCITRDYWFGIQIGDGKCVVFDNQLECSEPIPWDDDCQGNQTTSICDSDAIDEFRYFKDKELPIAVFIGCDGVDGSYANDNEFHSLYRNILHIFAEYGADKGRDEVHGFLPNLSKKGSGDDVSIAGIVKAGISPKMIDYIKTQIEYENAIAAFERIEKESAVAKEKVDYINVALQKARDSLAENEDKLKKAELDCEQKIIELSSAEKRRDEAVRALESARIAFGVCGERDSDIDNELSVVSFEETVEEQIPNEPEIEASTAADTSHSVGESVK